LLESSGKFPVLKRFGQKEILFSSLGPYKVRQGHSTFLCEFGSEARERGQSQGIMKIN
jgi:hypothetical protein